MATSTNDIEETPTLERHACEAKSDVLRKWNKDSIVYLSEITKTLISSTCLLFERTILGINKC